MNTGIKNSNAHAYQSFTPNSMSIENKNGLKEMVDRLKRNKDKVCTHYKFIAK